MGHANVAVIGAGILGLAHAWSAAKRGHRVTVFERSARAAGASIRNFGMVWPIGQPAGAAHALALRSREAWLELADASGLWVDRCGSIHLAHRADEWEVLQEFAAMATGLGFECELLSAAQVLKRSRAANGRSLLGGLFSPTELCVNAPVVVRSMPKWLGENFGVEFRFGTTIVAIDNHQAVTASGQQHSFDRFIVCCGADVGTLFPELLDRANLRLCKLQMMKTHPQPGGWRIGTHLASGLTLRHYACFENCRSLTTLRARIAAESPELDRYGIHVMASQNDAGSVILGDSHEYGADIEPFDKQVIDQLILRKVGSILALPDWRISDRWHGYYAKAPTGPAFCAEPTPVVSVRTGAGGSGMTMGFGLAEKDWDQWT